ncbi:GNAT family protein [uncultured Tateyamaria sp.]|uniref:GNAT family N-acetyltransferase n=1 Tax=uncultured Tateyamaria sp. TaxID=455651 RepID=UPI00263508B5|nr:GNAT family protein [uncultured Tateyamaria sp.]
MITLAPLSPQDLDRVAHIEVRHDQIRYSGTVSEAFDAAEPDVDFHAILNDATPVGFFKIDRAYATRYPFAAPDGLGLRAFMIDTAHQGCGFGTRACHALPAYMTRQYPGRSALWLTVNIGNPVAYRAYCKGGFVDTGQIWPHGDAGPQNVMVMTLVSI